MKDKYNALDNFRNSLSRLEGHFHILEERVPVDTQISYFKYSETLRRKDKKPDVDVMTREDVLDYLNDDALSVTDKKQLLTTLAISSDIKHFRILEEYAREPLPSLRDWTLLALMESRIAIESFLSEEKQIYISTGLGGKGEKIRYFLLILSRDLVSLEPYQKDVVMREFSFLLDKTECEVERLTIGDKYVALVVLMPVRADIKMIIDNVLFECNEFGNFLSYGFTITNMREYTEMEIAEIIDKNERNSNSGR